MLPDEVHERLRFAQRRMTELLALNQGNLAGADASERQQFVQEFFFHLVGAIEVLAQLANERRNLGLDVEVASASTVIQALPQGDRLRTAVANLYVNTRPGRPVPSDPYSDEGVLYRIWNYRHQVTHRRRNPFRFNVLLSDTVFGGTAAEPAFGDRLRSFLGLARRAAPDQPAPVSGHFIIDPRDPGSPASVRTAQEEMERMRDLVETRCVAALALLP
jgi:hypothetical protein